MAGRNKRSTKCCGDAEDEPEARQTSGIGVALQAHADGQSCGRLFKRIMV